MVTTATENYSQHKTWVSTSLLVILMRLLKSGFRLQSITFIIKFQAKVLSIKSQHRFRRLRLTLVKVSAAKFLLTLNYLLRMLKLCSTDQWHIAQRKTLTLLLQVQPQLEEQLQLLVQQVPHQVRLVL